MDVQGGSVVRLSERLLKNIDQLTHSFGGATCNRDANKVAPSDSAVHEWYRFVLSFPPHLVRDYLARFLAPFPLSDSSLVLDPFCGTGTTIVECKKFGVCSLGIEANPMAHFATRVKVDWSPDPSALLEHSTVVAQAAQSELAAQGIQDDPLPLFTVRSQSSPSNLRILTAEQQKLLITNSISPRPLHKALALLDHLNRLRDDRFYHHQLLALAKSIVFSSSNLSFGPEVGVGQIKSDTAVIEPWLAGIRSMAKDLTTLADKPRVAELVCKADARDLGGLLTPSSIDAVITSPPYPNEKDYSRTTRLESVLLGFISNRAELQALKKTLVRSNTRSVYKNDLDDTWISAFPAVQELARVIENRRIELGKTSGFERMYHRVAKLYFGGMARHLANLRPLLKPGSHLAYVVGDQASYLRVMIRTGQLLADIAASLGYQVLGIDLFRTRLATATKEQLREEVVVLKWPG